MFKSQNNAISPLQKIPFFSGLPAMDIDQFTRAAKIHSYRRQQAIFLSGDTADRLFAVIDGCVKLYRTTDDGNEAVISLASRGDIFGETDIFADAEYPYSAEAVAESRVAEIPATLLREHLGSTPAVTARMIAMMSKKIRELQAENENLSIKSAPQRVGGLLLHLSAGMPCKGGTFPLPYGKSLAASKLGMTRETFSRALASLRKLGVTSKGHEITIENFECLAAHCKINNSV